MSLHRIPLAAAVLAAAGSFLVSAPAHAWAPAATAPIHPGVQTITGGTNQCTANFVFQDSAGAVYIGQAAHCASTGAATSTNGCLATTMPLNTTVTVGGALWPAKMVYSSWIAMKAVPEPSTSFQCQYNDLAIVALDSRDWGRVNPSVPYWGGPRAVRTAPLSTGNLVYSYGNSSLRFGIAATSPKRGISLGDTGGGWSHGLYTLTPGIPGDSGSGFLDANGDAFGVLSTISVAPIPASNNAGDLSKEIAYMQAHSTFTTANVVPGDVPFVARVP
ncbi:MAG: hypothetical protein QOE45_2257 [Frankiaceae bacterium]|jgi:hypothetical protein|nr:hypothetical protein [Frankiaceae bacterium]